MQPTSTQHFYLLRHGLSMAQIDPKEYLRVGDKNVALSPEGKKQAFESGQAFAKVIDNRFQQNPDARNQQWIFLVSPMLRAVQHHQHFMMGLGNHAQYITEHLIRTLLHEQNFGLLNGLTRDEIQTQYPWEYEKYQMQVRNGLAFYARPPNGERPLDVLYRSINLVEEIKVKKWDNVICAAHGTVERTMTIALMEYPTAWWDTEKNANNAAIRHIEWMYDANGGIAKRTDHGRIFNGFPEPAHLVKPAQPINIPAGQHHQ